MKKTFRPQITEKQELLHARIAAAVAIGIAGLFGIYPPGFVAEVVAFAFGLAAASFFPVIMLGIFFKRMNKEAAIAGMITGLTFTFGYIGTHIPAKGIHHLLEAFGRLDGKPRLRIWGRPRGQDTKALMALADSLPGDAAQRHGPPTHRVDDRPYPAPHHQLRNPD